MSGFNRKAAITIFLTLFIGLLFLPPISLRLKTLAAVINLLIPSGDWRPLQLFTPAPSKEVKTIRGASGRTLDISIYHPRREANVALIIYTPLLGDGAEDSRLVNLASTFSRLGFIVAVPFHQEKPRLVSTKDAEDVISTALFLKNESGLPIDRLGFFGISYGNGPTMVASVDPQIKNLVSFIISFGGFYDLEDALSFIRTGEYAYRDIEGKREPHAYAKEILSNTIAYYEITEAELSTSEILANLREKLSPSRVVEQITADVFVVHSTDDPYIPYTESMRLYDNLRRRSAAITVLALTTALEHGDYKPYTLKNLRQDYLPSFVDFYKLLYTLLKKHL